jgi:hypothetical protein
VFGKNINLFKVDCVRLEHFHACEADRRITCEGNPETTLALGISQDLLASDLVKNRIRGVASKKLSSGEFYGSDQVQIARSGASNSV